MQYMLLIYNSGDWQDLSPEQQQEIGGAYFAFTEELQAAGKMVAGDALHNIAGKQNTHALVTALGARLE